MYGWTATLLMSPKTGPITNSVRNSAMPVSTWFGGDVGSPSAFRVRPSTTMILVNDVASSSTDGAIDSTVIARIRVIELLGEPLPTEMPMLPAPGTTGDVGATGAVGSTGAAEAGPASRTTNAAHSSANRLTSAARRRVREPGRRSGCAGAVMVDAPSARASNGRGCPSPDGRRPNRR